MGPGRWYGASVPGPLTCDANGVRLAYTVTGDVAAPPLVLLHGLTSDGSSWEQTVPLLADEWRVYVPDLRGHGQSEWPGDYSFETMSRDLLGFMDVLGLRRATLVGHSMGGVLAYLLAEEHPNRVEALVLEETPPPLPQHRPVPSRPDEPLAYDWAVRTSILAQVNQPDPRWWDRLLDLTVPTLVVAGGPESPFSQDEMAAVAGPRSWRSVRLDPCGTWRSSQLSRRLRAGRTQVPAARRRAASGSAGRRTLGASGHTSVVFASAGGSLGGGNALFCWGFGRFRGPRVVGGLV